MASFLYKQIYPQTRFQMGVFKLSNNNLSWSQKKFDLIVKVITKHENSMVAFMENVTSTKKLFLPLV